MRELNVIIVQVSPKPIPLFRFSGVQGKTGTMTCVAIAFGVNADGRKAVVTELAGQLRAPREDLHCHRRALSHTMKVESRRRDILHAQLIKNSLP